MIAPPPVAVAVVVVPDSVGMDSDNRNDGFGGVVRVVLPQN